MKFVDHPIPFTAFNAEVEMVKEALRTKIGQVVTLPNHTRVLMAGIWFDDVNAYICYDEEIVIDEVEQNE